MRDIKFRAWCPKDERMFEWEDIGIESYNSYILIPRNETDKLGQRNWDSDLILMQYTELKDKNGKEIYEGDICKIKDSMLFLRVVQYDLATGSYIFYRKGDVNMWFNNGEKGIEVIGNKYENPELLVTNSK